VARTSSETVRLLYHSRTLIVAVVGMIGVVIGVVVSHGNIGNDELGRVSVPLLGVTFAVLAAFAWLGWIDYASASALAIDERGVKVASRLVPWSEIRSVRRATGTFRVVLGTERGPVRFQLLVLPRPIASLKTLVAEATKAGAKIEPYLVRLAEHVDEDADEPEP
jgi:hypothetical protein